MFIYLLKKNSTNLSICACVWAYTHECSAHKGQKMALSYLELKLKPLKNFQRESQIRVLWKSIFLIDSQGPDLCFPHNIIHRRSKMWQKPQSPCVNLGTFTGVCVQDVMWRVAGFLQEVPPQDERGSSLLREMRFG